MENLEETDNITKNIVQEIVRECKKIKLYTDENFCVYYVKLLTLDPLWKISPEKKLNRENIQNIVTFIIAKLNDFNSFDLVTLKIQHIFLSLGSSRQVMLQTHDQAVTTALGPLHEDILAYSVDDRQTEQKLYRKIALYSTLKSGLGNPKHLPVLKEAMFALKSILEEDDVTKFLEMKREAKIVELAYFQNLIAGIRLFHRDCGRPSAEIEDLPKMLSQALIATMIDLQNELLVVMEEVNLTTTAIDSVFVLKKLKTPKVVQRGGKTINLMIELELVLPEGIVFQDVQDAMNLLILARQREVYVRKLLKDVEQVEICAKRLFNTLQHVLTNLHNCVKFKVAVSTNVVYPLFVDMAETWKNIQDEAVLLSLYHKKFQRINDLNSTVNHSVDKLKIMIGSGEVRTDSMRLEKSMGNNIKNEQHALCKILQPDAIKDFYKIPLQYLGFCAWSLVQTGGGLIPGNPSLGVCKWKNKFYAFCHSAAAAEFGTDPDIIIMQALTIARSKPELINLLQLHDSINELRHVGELYQKPVEVIMMVNSDVQTEIHPIKEKIDPDYVWDTWDYYRQAIKLANVASCRTHSMQTKKSHFRYSVPVQTTEPRDKVCQTKTDNYMNVSKSSNYIFGLRGRKDDTQHIVQLTRPVDEEFFYKCAKSNKNLPPFKMQKKKCYSWKTQEKVESSTESSSTTSDHYISKSKQVVSAHEDVQESSSLEECICIKNIPVNNT